MGRVDFINSSPSKSEEFLPFYLGETQEEAEQNYKAFNSFISLISSSYAANTGIDPGEMFGAAIDGLARAARDWDPDRGGSFRTYATFRIRTALNECIRKNNSVVTIPEYIRVAHVYITNIKTILELYGEPSEVMSYSLKHQTFENIGKLNKVDRLRLEKELAKLQTLAKNSKVPYLNLIERSEYVPVDAYLHDDLSQNEMYEAERRRMAAALMVSKLQEKMTPEELYVANGIIAGKSYGEIGRTHTPKRSIAWVRQQLDNMKEKFSK